MPKRSASAKRKQFGGSRPRAGVVASKLVGFRSTPKEYAAYQRAADAAGVSMSKWLRSLADKASGKVR